MDTMIHMDTMIATLHTSKVCHQPQHDDTLDRPMTTRGRARNARMTHKHVYLHINTMEQADVRTKTKS